MYDDMYSDELENLELERFERKEVEYQRYLDHLEQKDDYDSACLEILDKAKFKYNKW